MPTDDVMRFFATWMLTHEVADDAIRAAVERGQREGDSAAFEDALAAMVAEEKERLREQLRPGAAGASAAEGEEQQRALQEMRFEIAELRGRIDALTTALESLGAKIDRLGGSGASGCGLR
ncbi:MAG: hypothetical protein AB2L09_12065 [Coriobacteriia bacterium]